MNSKSIQPFIYFFDLGKISNNADYEMYITDFIKEYTMCQVILTNWEQCSKDDIYLIYTLFQKYLIKVAFSVTDCSDVGLLEYILCNIYRIYVLDNALNNGKIINYFKKSNISIWLVINYDKYYLLKNTSDYQKICVDITGVEKNIELNCSVDKDLIIFFPQKIESKFIIPFGYCN